MRKKWMKGFSLLLASAMMLAACGNDSGSSVQIIFIRQILGKPQILPGCRVGILAVGYLQLNIILELILDDWISAVHVQVFRVLCAGAACLLALVLGLAVLAVLGLVLLAAFLLFPVAAIQRTGTKGRTSPSGTRCWPCGTGPWTWRRPQRRKTMSGSPGCRWNSTSCIGPDIPPC